MKHFPISSRNFGNLCIVPQPTETSSGPWCLSRLVSLRKPARIRCRRLQHSRQKTKIISPPHLLAIPAPHQKVHLRAEGGLREPPGIPAHKKAKFFSNPAAPERARGFASPGYPGFAHILRAETNHTILMICAQRFFCAGYPRTRTLQAGPTIGASRPCLLPIIDPWPQNRIQRQFCNLSAIFSCRRPAWHDDPCLNKEHID